MLQNPAKYSQGVKMQRQFCFLLLSVLALFAEHVLCVSEAQKVIIQSKFLEGGFQCIKDHPLSADEIKSFRDKMMPDGNQAKCFAACLFKKIGIMDDMGKITKMGALDSAKKIFGEDEHLKKVEDFIGKCSSVNEQSVSDGEMGCDRAKMAFACLAENAPKFGFNLNF